MSNQIAASRFDEIYMSTKSAILAFITAKCRRVDDVGDIFQDTYMELYRVLLKRGAEYVTHGKALVFRIARRKIAKYYSLLKRTNDTVSLMAFDEDGDAFERPEADPEAFLTEDFTVNKMLLEDIVEHIRKKPQDVQKIFHLHYYIGLTIAETAKSLGISESNVKHKLYRTLDELRNLLQ